MLWLRSRPTPSRHRSILASSARLPPPGVTGGAAAARGRWRKAGVNHTEPADWMANQQIPRTMPGTGIFAPGRGRHAQHAMRTGTFSVWPSVVLEHLTPPQHTAAQSTRRNATLAPEDCSLRDQSTTIHTH